MSINTPQGIYSDNSRLYAVTVNGTLYGGWKVYVATPNGTVIDPWVWVVINYYVYTAPWWLGGWSVTYGEQDNYYNYYTGSAALSLYNGWESVNTDSGYALAAICLLASMMKAPIVQAIAFALEISGITLIYESSTMINYYESTGFSYILFDFVNDYFYLWALTPLGSFASSFGLYRKDWSGNFYTFWYNVPYVAYTGILAVAFSADVSNCCHQFVGEYGSGTWVWFN